MCVGKRDVVPSISAELAADGNPVPDFLDVGFLHLIQAAILELSPLQETGLQLGQNSMTPTLEAVSLDEIASYSQLGNEDELHTVDTSESATQSEETSQETTELKPIIVSVSSYNK